MKLYLFLFSKCIYIKPCLVSIYLNNFWLLKQTVLEFEGLMFTDTFMKDLLYKSRCIHSTVHAYNIIDHIITNVGSPTLTNNNYTHKKYFWVLIHYHQSYFFCLVYTVSWVSHNCFGLCFIYTEIFVFIILIHWWKFERDK